MGGDSPRVPGSVAVAVGVLTYRRLESLAILLDQLVDQADALDTGPARTSQILVIDNDPSGSARSVAARSPGRVRYVHEPTPGIAAARARAVQEARWADVLVFIDDDERPGAGWLEHLVDVWVDQGRPAGVVGRVSPAYPGEVDPWIAAGGFFTRRNYPTGTRVAAASSANLLLNLQVLRELDLTFDRRLGLRGGEDTLLTRSLTRSGQELVWCNEAEVVDLIPASRMNRRWVLARAFHHGAVASRVEIALSPRPVRSRAKAAVGGLARIAGGGSRVIAGVVGRGVGSRARGWRLIYRGAGLVAGALGRDVVEYDRTP